MCSTAYIEVRSSTYSVMGGCMQCTSAQRCHKIQHTNKQHQITKTKQDSKAHTSRHTPLQRSLARHTPIHQIQKYIQYRYIHPRDTTFPSRCREVTPIHNSRAQGAHNKPMPRLESAPCTCFECAGAHTLQKWPLGTQVGTGTTLCCHEA